MKIRSERAPLAAALAWVAQALPKKPQMPVLAGIRLSAAGTTLTMQAFDFDVSHTADVELDVAASGECLVSGHFLRTIVASLKGDIIELVLDGDELTITCARSTYRTRVLMLNEYPTLPAFPKRVGEVPGAALAAMVHAVKFPIDDASPHPQVRGLHLDGSMESLTAVGASRFMVAECSTPWSRDSDFATTVHSRMFETAVKGLGDSVRIGCEDGLFGLSDGSRSVTLRTYADDYVAWRKLIRPQSQDAFEFTVPADDLRESCARAGMLAGAAAPLVLAFTEDQVEVSVTEQEIGGGSEAVAAIGTGSIELGMDHRFISEALAAIPSGEVVIGALDPKKPLILRPLDHPHMVSVLMPKPIPGGSR